MVSPSPSYLESVSFDLRLSPEAEFLLVALHGLTGSIQSVAPYLRRVGARWGVLVPDLRSHGETRFSGEPADFTADNLALDVASLIERVNVSRLPLVVLGVSLGASVAARIVQHRGSDVHAALFVRPTHSAEEPDHLAINLEIADLVENSGSLEECLEALETTLTFLEIFALSPSAAEATRKKLRECFMTKRVFRLREGSRWRVAAEDLAAVGCPSFVLAAPGDPLHPVEIARGWVAHLPQGQLVELPARDSVPENWDGVAARVVEEILVTGQVR